MVRSNPLNETNANILTILFLVKKGLLKQQQQSDNVGQSLSEAPLAKSWIRPCTLFTRESEGVRRRGAASCRTRSNGGSRDNRTRPTASRPIVCATSAAKTAEPHQTLPFNITSELDRALPALSFETDRC